MPLKRKQDWPDEEYFAGKIRRRGVHDESRGRRGEVLPKGKDDRPFSVGYAEFPHTPRITAYRQKRSKQGKIYEAERNVSCQNDVY
jgi:hypothetical protein